MNYTVTRTLRAFLVGLIALTGCGDVPAATVTAEELCTAMRRCLTEVDQEACVRIAAPQISYAEKAGCAPDMDAVSLCTIDAYNRAADEGMCDEVSVDGCADLSATLQACVRENGFQTNFACNMPTGIAPSCVEYENAVVAPEATCETLGATLIPSCPADNFIGRCVSGTRGATLTTTYYEPLPTSVTVDTLEAVCSGTWTPGT